MFIQPCFIRKNTPELRKKLEELGYEPCHRMTIYPNAYKNIAVCNFFGSKYYGVSEEEVSRPGSIDDAIKNRGMIDCETNEKLFLALAALRDDTDRHQWFVDDNTGIWERSENELPSRYMQMEGHKATVEEIIKYFT